MGATYDYRDIVVLEALDAIRMRPRIYVGDIDNSRVLSTCVVESVRTLIHVGASRLIVTIEDDTTFEIVGEDALFSTDTRMVEAVFASMSCACRCIHTRRPMVAECNPALTNALSASFEVEVVGEGACTRVRWRQGRLDGGESFDAPGAPPIARVRGVLDRQIFGEHAVLVIHELDVLLDDLAVLAVGVRIHRRDARDGSTREYHAPGGLADRVATRGVRDPLRLRTEQEDGGVLELALGWAGDGAAHVDAWSAGWDTSPAALGEALLAALAEVLLPRRIPFERGPHAALSANLARGLVAALAVDTPATAKSPVGPPSAETLKPALAPYLLARPVLLAELARRIGDTPDALSARLSTS